ncbi:hypothetical protein Poli38472_002774 [Pythium oligandrum]|uniref:TLC domain-containing protein n=1 Tax=Pythium oligandrum TaxID=41045 RepID=A0A8K1CK22_PYTOL|nr:hypothetical protein Poli38472_002774 [Pythium oligandrum]|eukprot:TMW63833.1 hypothetical protein Poli38472_002774 [Pythium oligandrum]
MSKSTRIQFSLPQLVMGAMTGMLVPLMWCEVKGVAKMREHPVFHVTPGMPKVSDMWIALAMAVGLIAIRYVVSKAFYPLSRAILPPGVRESAFRVDRLATSLFKVVFFTWIAVLGYDVIKDEEWFPVSLGGSGDIVKVFKVFDVAPSTSLKYYVLLQVAYQMHSLLYVLLMKPLDGDTMDFVVHDFTSILAMGSSYLVNYLALSATVGFLNDACDIFQYAFFIATDSERKPVISVMYLVLLVIWGYTRLYVYPVEVISNVFVELPGNNPNASRAYYWSGETMLCAMFGLQAWWFFLFAEKGRRKLMKKSPYTKIIGESKALKPQERRWTSQAP